MTTDSDGRFLSGNDFEDFLKFNELYKELYRISDDLGRLDESSVLTFEQRNMLYQASELIERVLESVSADWGALRYKLYRVAKTEEKE